LQLRAVEQKQIEFTQEISRFPHVEIQALKNIIEMCKSLDLFKDKVVIDDKPKQLTPETIKKVRQEIYGFDYDEPEVE